MLMILGSCIVQVEGRNGFGGQKWSPLKKWVAEFGRNCSSNVGILAHERDVAAIFISKFYSK
jgi:hypothetical protein